MYGPYPDRRGFRLVLVGRIGDDPESGRRSRVFPTQEEAHRIKVELQRQLSVLSMTVDGLAGEYLRTLPAEKRRRAMAEERLRKMFGRDCHDPIRSITPARARQLLAAVTAGGSSEYHRSVLRAAQGFARWCVEHRYLKVDPFATLRITGPRPAGKQQLRVDEARRWSTAALAEIERGGYDGLRSLGALTLLLVGCRPSELLAVTGRDVDDGGRLLWLAPLGGKTRAARRQVEIPELVRPYLVARAAQVGPDGRVFGTYTYRWLSRATHRLCRLAGVPRVCAYSLRGLHGTLAVTAGSTSAQVAAQLGHDPRCVQSVTEQHYISPAATSAARQGAVLRVLDGGAGRGTNPAQAVPQVEFSSPRRRKAQ